MMSTFLVIFFSLFLILPLSSFSQDVNFKADSVYAYIKHLSVSIGPRPMGSANEQRALQWTRDTFARFGADESYILPFTKCKNLNTNSGIAVGVFYGKTDSAFVVGGHIDSGDNETPGANDDASGCASVIELARIWSQRERHYTMIFTAFGGEESGLCGSQHFVEFDPHISNVVLMISLDMTGSDDDIITMFETHKAQAPSWLVKDVFALDQRLNINRLLYPTHFSTLNNLSSNGPGSDHIPFLNNNIPAIDFSVGIENSPIHTAQDKIENIDKTMLGTVGELADHLIMIYQTYGIPQGEDKFYLVWQLFGSVFFSLSG